MRLHCSCQNLILWIGTALGLLLLANGSEAEELRLDARALYERSITRDLRIDAAGAGIELERGVLIEDDGPAAGFSYQPNEERLGGQVRIRKELVVADPRARRATLLVAPGGTLEAEVNGQVVMLPKPGRAGNYWQAYDLPVETLKAGRNDIILHGTGKVWIARADEFAAGSRTRSQHPNRSARSTDGGRTWDTDHLGPGADVDGEYYVRLFLDQHRPQGLLTSPIIDLGNLAEQPISAPVTSPGPVRIAIGARLGVGGRITARVRLGSTPVPTAKSWGPWQLLEVPAGRIENASARYLQLELELATADAGQTPQLQEVRIEANPRRGDDWTGRLKVVEARNEKIIRTSIPFTYEPFDQPRLKELRQRYQLDAIVHGARTDLELAGRLAVWTARQWERGHLKDGYPAWDALQILHPHADGQPVGGFCQQYNIVFLQACESFGLPGRPVSLGPGDHGGGARSGHEVVEVWCNEHRKWVYVDGQKAWYFTEPSNNTPLSLLELRQLQMQALQGKRAAPPRLVRLGEAGAAWDGLEGFPPFLELRLIPRSNFLEEKAPLPLNQGMRGWFWTGHHVWTDEERPASLLYSQRVSNRNNWQWTLNQAHFVLEATDEAGVVLVHVDTETPGFETFLANFDGKGPQPVAPGFRWRLHPGKNRLEVQPRNRAGREGIASWIVLDHRP